MTASKDRPGRDLPVKAFASLQTWEAWLKAQPETSRGVWLKLAKKSAKTASVSRQEAIDGALCHGWIDGQLDKFDDHWWLIRFTPRKLVWWFRSSLHFSRESFQRTSEPKPH
jgi:uncharacterized protein YdeI (YjbR/CyaY-like superfamily)